jgi:hypothetical protein
VHVERDVVPVLPVPRLETELELELLGGVVDGDDGAAARCRRCRTQLSRRGRRSLDQNLDWEAK